MNRHQTVKVHNNEYLTDSLEDDVFGGRFLATLQRLVPWVFHGVYRWWNNGQYYVEPDRHSYLHRQKYTFEKEKPDEQKQKKKAGIKSIIKHAEEHIRTDRQTVPRFLDRPTDGHGQHWFHRFCYRSWAAVVSSSLGAFLCYLTSLRINNNIAPSILLLLKLKMEFFDISRNDKFSWCRYIKQNLTNSC